MPPAVAAIAARFRAGLPARLDAITAAIGRARAGDPAGATEARRLAHSLRGAGGTFGYPDLSTQAAALESALERGLREADIDTELRALAQSIIKACS